MQYDLSLKDLHLALRVAGITDFTDSFVALGGGEVNTTYKLNLDNKQIILRIAKDEGQQTLQTEARALNLLDSPHIPKLIFFSKHTLINNRLWILESYIFGSSQKRLSLPQFNKLGNLLAQVHKQPSSEIKVGLRQQFLDSCKAFGDEEALLDHPDKLLRKLIRSAFKEFESLQPSFNLITPTLIHSDATPSNILVDGDEVGLIDWEFSKFSDPLCDFSTIYYEDVEYNQGKWRIKIKEDEKQSLFDGYESGGGKIDEERIRFWIRFDKLGAAVFLYWRIHESTRLTSQAEAEQYQLDFDNLVSSLSS